MRQTETILAEVRLVVTTTGARLVLKRGGEVVDDDAWDVGRKIGTTEAAELAQCLFHDAFDLLQFVTHGH